MRELWIDTWRSIVAHRVRFGLTALGIAWGAFMLTFLSSMTRGFERHFVTEFEKAGPKVITMGSGVILKTRVGERGARGLELKVEDVDRVATLRLVEAVSPEVDIWASPVRTGRRSKLMRLVGLSSDADEIRNFEIAKGRFLSPTDIHRKARVAVLGAVASERLFDHLDAIGQSIRVDGLRLRVIGVMVSKGHQLMDSGDPDDLKIIVPYTTAQRWLTATDRIQRFVVAPTTKESGYVAIRQIRELTALHNRYDPTIESAMWAFNIQEPLAMIRAIFFGIRIFMFGAGLVTLFVGAVGVMNIMLVVVGERTQEIGVRMALGARGRDVFAQVLVEASLVSAVSGVSGAVLGVATIQGFARVIPKDASYQSPPILDPATIATYTLVLIGVGVVSGAIPAIRAARIMPSEAIRKF